MRLNGLRDYKLYIIDIQQAILKIESFINNISFEEFLKNDLIFDAVVRNIEIIGEATKNIPEKIKKKYYNIDWGGDNWYA
jgi:uncharacterized protein with HEPN domain